MARPIRKLIINSMDTKYILASTTVGIMLLSTGTAFADSDKGEGSEHGLKLGFHIGKMIGLNSEIDHDRRDKDKDRHDDDDRDGKTKAEIRAEMAARLSHITGGIVTAVNGSIFTIDPFGNKSTTTVTTDSSTVFKTKGSATSTSALTVGSKVLVMGTTTATSTSGDAFTASLVKFIGEGFGHLRFWFGLRS